MARRNPLVVPQSHAEPTYRFWGSQKPPERREPIRATVTSTDTGSTTAVIRLYGPIDDLGGVWGVSAAEFAAALDELPDSVTSIDMHVNSPGGMVYEGITILNLLRQHPADVTAYVDGLAASAASFIAFGVDECVMMPNSQAMIHDGWGICIGPASDMHAMGGLLDKVSNNIASVYAEKAGGTVQDWRGVMLAETWYDAQEAVAAGLADAVGSDADEGKPEAGFDLSQFRHQGRSEAPTPTAAGGATVTRDEHAARARTLTLHERRSA